MPKLDFDNLSWVKPSNSEAPSRSSQTPKDFIRSQFQRLLHSDARQEIYTALIARDPTLYKWWEARPFRSFCFMEPENTCTWIRWTVKPPRKCQWWAVLLQILQWAVKPTASNLQVIVSSVLRCMARLEAFGICVVTLMWRDHIP